MRMEIDQFLDAKAAFKLTNTIKTMFSIVFGGNTPEIVALNSPLARIAHGLHMQKWSTGILCAELRRNAIVIAGLIAVENHEILRKNFAFILSSIELYFVVFMEGIELFLQKRL